MGSNYYPQDVEDAVRRRGGHLQAHAVAVVLPADDAAGRPERIGVLAEVSAVRPPAAMVSAIREAAAQELGGASVDVVLMRRNGLLRTTSGKFQRLLMRQQLLAGALDGVLVHVAADEHVSHVGRGRTISRLSALGKAGELEAFLGDPLLPAGPMTYRAGRRRRHGRAFPHGVAGEPARLGVLGLSGARRRSAAA